MSILHHWGTVARPAPSCDVMVPETPPPAFAAVRFFLLARFFLFLPAFFPGAGTDGTDDDTVRNIVVDSGFFEVVVCCCLLKS
jgi:hypothetical protein